MPLVRAVPGETPSPGGRGRGTESVGLTRVLCQAAGDLPASTQVRPASFGGINTIDPTGAVG